MTTTAPPTPAPDAGETAWYRLTAQDAASRLGVDPAQGLSSAEAAARLQQNGPNVLAAKAKVPPIVAFLNQYRDFMQLILVGAALVSIIGIQDFRTAIILLGLTVFNAVLGLQQEAKAEASIAGLQQMLKSVARVRRDGQVEEVDPSTLVTGDVVLVEAGDRIPADGRLTLSATLEVEEGALTGESVPVSKEEAAADKPDLALGDQHSMVFMNTVATKGRGEFLVTATGMATQIGRVARLLNETGSSKTPLQKQLDRLTIVIAALAGLAMIAVIAMGVARGETQGLFFLAITLAIAAIPTGLPAVVTTLYSMGTQDMAKQGAIIKRLPSVETLGSVSAICSDKTGTLTLNKMTAREFIIPGEEFHFTVSGEGYATEGVIRRSTGAPVDLDPYLTGLVLCADATLRDGELIGDPTEGALIVLGAKSGLDIEETRALYPRIAEVPFDAAYKFMATFHRMKGEDGQDVIRAYVKGAPDVLLARGANFRRPDGELVPVNDERKARAAAENDRMAAKGERVMVLARRDFDPASFDPAADHFAEIQDLTLLTMVGIVDPPRPEAKLAIADCKSAGIQVRMITGDHVTTAAAIAGELGIPGEAMLGRDFEKVPDAELTTRLPQIGVVARVTPEDKLRMVTLLQGAGNIVAMTGDGVNDAPALKKADIGVAMGITGTEVSKDAAVMVLTDDNFATIVKAVEYGRGLYERLSRYIRYQIFSLVGFILLFLLTGLLGLASLVPLQVLFVNFGVNSPIGIALGLRRAGRDVMLQPPRPLSQPVLTAAQWTRLAILGAICAVGAVAVSNLAPVEFGEQDSRTTLLFVTFALTQIVGAFSFQQEYRTCFTREIIQDRSQAILWILPLVLLYLTLEFSVLQRVFDTVPLTAAQWGWCLIPGLVVLFGDEAFKWVARRTFRKDAMPPSQDLEAVLVSRG